MKQTCSNCKWLDNLPFADEWVCVNENSEYADCPTKRPQYETCSEWKGREEKD